MAGYFALQMLFSTASKAKESIELVRLKEFGAALQGFRDPRAAGVTSFHFAFELRAG
jgi:hypothetical protein